MNLRRSAKLSRVLPLVPRAYSLGVSIVVTAILVAGGICLSIFAKQTAPPAGENLATGAYQLENFQLTERSGKPVTPAELANDVWIAAFIFTRCPSSCPMITTTMRGIQDELKDSSNVRLVSISVDPEYDSTEVLTEYANKFAADRERWWFLTGSRDPIYELIQKQFRLSIGTSTEDEMKAGAEQVAHTDRLVLVAKGNKVVGTYSSRELGAVQRLIRDAKLYDTEGTWPRRLPEINASLNATCSVLLMIAWVFILSGRRKAHAATMISAIAVSAIFLTCYLVYHFMVGSMPFRGYGVWRVVYFTILLSHTALATFGVVPLVLLTVLRAYRGQFHAHAQLARVTFPIWLYVSITGVVIYWMLYRVDFSPQVVG